MSKPVAIRDGSKYRGKAPTIYGFSDRWKKWGTPDFDDSPKHKTNAMNRPQTVKVMSEQDKARLHKRDRSKS
jgi:hypothetical protein